jgi:hypothetical protein
MTKLDRAVEFEKLIDDLIDLMQVQNYGGIRPILKNSKLYQLAEIGLLCKEIIKPENYNIMCGEILIEDVDRLAVLFKKLKDLK